MDKLGFGNVCTSFVDLLGLGSQCKAFSWPVNEDELFIHAIFIWNIQL